MAIVHNLWMMTPEAHQANLIAALIDVATGSEAQPFMTANKEAMALITQSRRVEGLLREGHCPLAALMALAQQAIRAAAMACVQSDQREHTVTDLIARTVPGATN